MKKLFTMFMVAILAVGTVGLSGCGNKDKKAGGGDKTEKKDDKKKEENK